MQGRKERLTDKRQITPALRCKNLALAEGQRKHDYTLGVNKIITSFYTCSNPKTHSSLNGLLSAAAALAAKAGGTHIDMAGQTDRAGQSGRAGHIDRAGHTDRAGTGTGQGTLAGQAR